MEPVVLDHGSAFIKAGYANPDADPTVVLPSAFLPSRGTDAADLASADWSTPSQKDLIHPTDGGRIGNWPVMEDTWQYLLYDQLGWEEGNEGAVFVAEPILTPKVDREYLAQIMFETFNVSGFFTMEAPVLSMYSMGRLTGCCVDVGHTKIGSWDLEVLMGKLLAKSNPEHAKLLASPKDAPADSHFLRDLKERFLAVAASPDSFKSAAASHAVKEFSLPDGQVIYVAGEGVVAGEALFQPHIAGLEASGIADLLLQSVSDAATSVAGGAQESERVKSLLESIAVVGGGSMTQGFNERLLSDVSSALPPSMRPAIIKAPEYMPENTARYSAWYGGAIVAKVVFAQNQHVTRGEYDEKGPSAASKKLL